MERMQSEAQEISAEGIVGVQLQEKSHGWGSHTIEFFAVGTAIIPREGHDRRDRTADDRVGPQLRTDFYEAPPGVRGALLGRRTLSGSTPAAVAARPRAGGA